MGLKDEIPDLLGHIEKHKGYLAHNEALFNINEGGLLPYIVSDLKKQFSEKALKCIMHRVFPVNVLKRIIDKLSSVYNQPPTRSLKAGTDSDGELFSYYQDVLPINTTLSQANLFYNLQKGCLIEPYINRWKKPSLRVISYDKFLPYCTDETDPTVPTHMILLAGGYKREVSKTQSTVIPVYKAYTDEEFLFFDGDGNVIESKMAEIDNLEGKNVYGKIPFIYANKSKNLLIPIQDTDVLPLTKIIAILFSDLNYAVMYQAFSIIYAINLDVKKLEMAPNALWDLTGKSPEEKPELGTIKPQVDIQQVLTLIQAEFSIWLNTLGMRPGAVGQLTQDNFSSGISKMIDESDTTEARNRQVVEFSAVESDLFNLTMNYMHPVWSENNLVDKKQSFSLEAKVESNFAEQLPLMSRGELVKTCKEEVSAGFMPRRQAIRKLNPTFTDDQLDEYIAEIDKERTEIKVQQGFNEGGRNDNQMAAN